MQRVDLTSVMTAAEQVRLKGKKLTVDSFDTLISTDTDVYKPSGELLLKFRKRVIDSGACANAYRILRTIREPLTNRMTAALGYSERPVLINQKGVSQTNRIRSSDHPELRGSSSGIIGYFDRGPRFPYCRQTAFSLDHPDMFAGCMDFIKAIDGVFAREVPDRYKAQKALVAHTSPDFYIHGTAFTTITVNKNFRTLVHKDAGDLKEGFGVMTALQGGKYQGGYTVFPAFRVACDMRTGDVLLADVHEWHGNTEIIGEPGKYERVSCVFYYREKIQYCGTAKEELKRVLARKEGDPLNGTITASDRTVRFPVFVPSRGRFRQPQALRLLSDAKIPATVVVEPHEASDYRLWAPPGISVLELPESGKGIVYVRQFILDYSRKQGYERYWQIDDNIRNFLRMEPGQKPHPVAINEALAGIEDEALNVPRVALASADYSQFAVFASRRHDKSLNTRAYCCVLTSTKTGIDYRPETAMKEDVDFCVQHLAQGWNTVLSHRYAMVKPKMGGNGTGGLAEGYKAKKHEEAARTVHSLWPDHSRLIEKPDGLDVQVIWKHFKAEQYARQ